MAVDGDPTGHVRDRPWCTRRTARATAERNPGRGLAAGGVGGEPCPSIVGVLRISVSSAGVCRGGLVCPGGMVGGKVGVAGDGDGAFGVLR